jgi:hypothetical protein
MAVETLTMLCSCGGNSKGSAYEQIDVTAGRCSALEAKAGGK